MSEVIVTLKYSENNSMDIVLPEDVPSQFLARTLAEKVLKLPTSSEQIMILSSITPSGIQRLAPAGTLSDSGILNGAILTLSSEKTYAGFTAYLLSNSGIKFLLHSTNLIGRQSSNANIHLEIDLTHLDERKIISRNHARIETQENSYMLFDLGSRNGTYLNGALIAAGDRIKLNDGDIVDFGPRDKGGITLKFVCQL